MFSFDHNIVIDPSHLAVPSSSSSQRNSSTRNEPSASTTFSVDLKHTATSLCATSASGNTLAIASLHDQQSSSLKSPTLSVQLFSKGESSASPSSWIPTSRKSVSLSASLSRQKQSTIIGGGDPIQSNNDDDDEVSALRSSLLGSSGASNKASSKSSESDEIFSLRNISISNTGSICVLLINNRDRKTKLFIIKGLIHYALVDDDKEEDELEVVKEELFVVDSFTFSDFASCTIDGEETFFFVDSREGLKVVKCLGETISDDNNNKKSTDSKDSLSILDQLKKLKSSARNTNELQQATVIFESSVLKSCTTVSVVNDDCAEGGKDEDTTTFIVTLVCFNTTGGCVVANFSLKTFKLQIVKNFLGSVISDSGFFSGFIPCKSQLITAVNNSNSNSNENKSAQFVCCCGWATSRKSHSQLAASRTNGNANINNSTNSSRRQKDEILQAMSKRADMEESSPLAPVIVPGINSSNNNNSNYTGLVRVVESNYDHQSNKEKIMGAIDDEDVDKEEAPHTKKQMKRGPYNSRQQSNAPTWNQALVPDYEYNKAASSLIIASEKDNNNDNNTIHQSSSLLMRSNDMNPRKSSLSTTGELMMNFSRQQEEENTSSLMMLSQSSTLLTTASSNELTVVLLDLKTLKISSCCCSDTTKYSSKDYLQPNLFEIFHQSCQKKFDVVLMCKDTSSSSSSQLPTLRKVQLAIDDNKNDDNCLEVKNQSDFPLSTLLRSEDISSLPFVITGIASSLRNSFLALVSERKEDGRNDETKEANKVNKKTEQPAPSFFSASLLASSTTSRFLDLERHVNVIEINDNDDDVRKREEEQEEQKQKQLLETEERRTIASSNHQPSSTASSSVTVAFSLSDVENMMTRVVGDAMQRLTTNVGERLDRIEKRLSSVEEDLKKVVPK